MATKQLQHSLQPGGSALAALPASLLACLPALQQIRVRAGASVFLPRDRCAGFPVVESGQLRVLCDGADGRSLLLYRVQPGESCVISLGCLLSGRPYSARGEAETDAVLRLLPAAAFDRLLAEDASFRNLVLGQVGERMAALMQRIDGLAFQRFDQRLAAHLLSGTHALDCTHQALADELGCAREVVSRTLGGFAEAGWVRLGRGRIEVIDAAALAALSARSG